MPAWFGLTGPDGTPLSTNLWKGGRIHAFVGRLTAVASPVPELAELTLLDFDQDVGAHMFHLLLSVPVGTYDLDWRLFRCCGELPPERLPTITNIPVASFGALHAVSTVSRDDHRVHLEGVRPSGWQTMPCDRASSNEEVRSLFWQGLAFLTPDASAPLFHMEGSFSSFSK